MKFALHIPNVRLVILSLIFAELSTGCATRGPIPTDSSYSQAVRIFPVSRDALYSSSSSWFPNNMLGSMRSFNAEKTRGRLFFTPDRLTFAVYDETTNTFRRGYESLYSNIRWGTIENYGLSRIIRMQSDNAVQSFTFSDAQNSEGEDVDKDEVVKFLVGKFPPKE